MSNLKVGDAVKVVCRKFGHRFNIGAIVEVIEYRQIANDYKVSDGNDSWYVKINEVELSKKYLKSNRCALSQLIKASEFKAIDLSVQMGKERTYLSSTASESRFNGRGDISQVKLDEIKLNMSLAETALKTKNYDSLVAFGFNNTDNPDFTFDIPKDLDTGSAIFSLGGLTNEQENEIERIRDSFYNQAILAEKPKCSVRDLTDDEKDQIKRDHWIYEKPKHNLNIFAILVTIAILVILLSIGYKYIF